MKDLGNSVSRIMFYLMVAVLLAWTASLTLSFVSTVLPQQPLAPYFSLVVFDAGTIIWLFTFLKHASGLPQRSIALLACALDLVGVGVMSFAELFLGGQHYATVPADLGTIALWTIGIWTFLNIAAVVTFHIVDPETLRSIAIKSATDKVHATALEKLGHQMEEIGHEVSNHMARGMVESSVLQLTGQKPVISQNFAVAVPDAAKLTDETPPTPILLSSLNNGRTMCLGVTHGNRNCFRYARPGLHTCAQHGDQEHLHAGKP